MGYPWKFRDILASADLNAAFAQVLGALGLASDTANAAAVRADAAKAAADAAAGAVASKITTINGKGGSNPVLGAADVGAMAVGAAVAQTQLPATVGTVKSVVGKGPDVAGNVPLAPSDIGAVSTAALAALSGAKGGLSTLTADTGWVPDGQLNTNILRAGAVGQTVAGLGADLKVPQSQLPAISAGLTGVFPYIRPAASLFTKRLLSTNLSASTPMSFTEVGDSLVHSWTPQQTSGSTSSFNAYAAYTKTSSANTVIACLEWDYFGPPPVTQGDFYFGLCGLNTSTGKGQSWYLNDTGGMVLETSASITAWSGSSNSINSPSQYSRRIWLKIENLQNPSSPRQLSVSWNGREWFPWKTDTVYSATFDQLGIWFRYSGSVTATRTNRVLHWSDV